MSGLVLALAMVLSARPADAAVFPNLNRLFGIARYDTSADLGTQVSSLLNSLVGVLIGNGDEPGEDGGLLNGNGAAGAPGQDGGDGEAGGTATVGTGTAQGGNGGDGGNAGQLGTGVTVGSAATARRATARATVAPAATAPPTTAAPAPTASRSRARNRPPDRSDATPGGRFASRRSERRGGSGMVG